MSIGIGLNARFDRCYKCQKKLGFFETMCSACGASNSGIKIFYFLVGICQLVILGLFALLLAPGLMIFLLDMKILPPSISDSVNGMAAFSLANSSMLYNYIIVAVGAVLLLTILGNFYLEKLKKDIQGQSETEIAPEKAIPIIPGLPQVKDLSIDGLAQAFFTPVQNKIFRFVVIAFIVSIILPFFSGTILALIPAEKYQGWSILLVFLTAAFTSLVPILFVAMIALFIVFIYKNSKTQASKNSPKQDLK